MAQSVTFNDFSMIVQLKDARTLSIPLAWFPRLRSASAAQREHYELLGGGIGIHWPDLDEDISVEGLLLGKPSIESHRQ